MKKLKKHPLLCLYLLFAVCFFAVSIFSFLSDLIFMPNESTLSLSDFTPINVEVLQDETAVATTNDPQLIYNGESSAVRNISYKLSNDGGGVVCAYYTFESEQDFSNRMRLFPQFSEEKNVKYLFPKNIASIRLDIGSESGEPFVFEEIKVNSVLPLSFYFLPSAIEVLLFFTLPILIYVLIFYIFDFYKSFRRILKIGEFK